MGCVRDNAQGSAGNAVVVAAGADGRRFHIHSVCPGGSPEERFFGRAGDNAVGTMEACGLCAGGLQGGDPREMVIRVINQRAVLEVRPQTSGKTTAQDQFKQGIGQGAADRVISIALPYARQQHPAMLRRDGQKGVGFMP